MFGGAPTAAADCSAVCRRIGIAEESGGATEAGSWCASNRHRSPGACRAAGTELALGSRAEGTTMGSNVTLLDLVDAVAEYSRSEAEVIATVVYMVNQGHVRLCGTFKAARFDLTRIAEA
jgi:hypothetical protein